MTGCGFENSAPFSAHAEKLNSVPSTVQLCPQELRDVCRRFLLEPCTDSVPRKKVGRKGERERGDQETHHRPQPVFCETLGVTIHTTHWNVGDQLPLRAIKATLRVLPYHYLVYLTPRFSKCVPCTS